LNKKHLILHIGRHKCGTSALQVHLHKDKEYLDRNNTIYPLTGRNNKVAHHDLGVILNPKLNYSSELIQKTKVKFWNEVKGYKTVIVSSEVFSNIQNTELVKYFFNDFKIITVCYFREILDYYVSAYSQKVHATNYNLQFQEFCNSTFVNYNKQQTRWSQISNSLICKYFHKPYLKNNDIVSDFYDSISLQVPHLKPTEVVNKSIGGNLLYTKILLNNVTSNSKSIYTKLSEIALLKKEYSNSFFISENFAHEVRSMHAVNNEFLENSYSVYYKSFIDKPLCPNYESLNSDLAFFKDNGLNLDINKLLTFKSTKQGKNKYNQ